MSIYALVKLEDVNIAKDVLDKMNNTLKVKMGYKLNGTSFDVNIEYKNWRTIIHW